MKTLFFLFISLLFIAGEAQAQTKTTTIKVSGECGTCKKKIEGAARQAGASYALWNLNTKVLTVRYNSTASNTAKIEKAIATAGYDTPDFPATDQAYGQLDDCCKYPRKTSAVAACASVNDCAKDGKCDKDKAAKADCCAGKAECKKS